MQNCSPFIANVYYSRALCHRYIFSMSYIITFFKVLSISCGYVWHKNNVLFKNCSCPSVSPLLDAHINLSCNNELGFVPSTKCWVQIQVYYCMIMLSEKFCSTIIMQLYLSSLYNMCAPVYFAISIRYPPLSSAENFILLAWINF